MSCHGESRNVCERAAAVTGLGRALIERAMARGISTLEDLELAAHDGRLARIPGFGEQRVGRVRQTLERYLDPPRRTRPLHPRPSVAMLLDLDAEYRGLAARGELPLVAPLRFNPEGHAWLPVWHTERGGFDVTVMYSNTARAFELGKRRDWVIIVYKRGMQDDHATVVTEHQGMLEGRRVIRARERECMRHYLGHRIRPEIRAWVHEMRERL